MCTDLCFLAAVELSHQLKTRKISAREVVSAHLGQIERVNPQVNAIVTLIADQALAEADRADEAIMRGENLGPLHGLPVAHKDLQPTRGVRTTFGSPIYRDFVPDADSPVVERIKRAGAISIVKTNVPEFGAGSQTFNPVFRATRNPYDLSKTPGGSSGGAAAALACGLVPLAVKRPAGFGMHPTVIDNALSMYFRPEGTELTLIALEDHNRMGEAPDSELSRVDKEFVMRAIDRLCERMPDMESGSLHSTHVGRDGLTPDQRAVIDQAGPECFYGLWL